MKKVKELIELNRIQYKEDILNDLKLHNNRIKKSIECIKVTDYEQCYFCSYLGYDREKINLFHIIMDSKLFLDFFSKFE